MEALYRDSPAISEICVVGVPYEDGSDTAIHAVIVPTVPDETTKEAIQHHLQTRAKELPSYQQFHKFHFWDDALPKTQDGVIDRQHLKCSLQTHIENTTRLHETPKAGAMDAESAAPRTDVPQEVLSTLSRLARMPDHQIRLESRLDIDLGLDSLTRLDLLLMLEARLGETIPDALLANLETVGDVVKLIETFQSDVERQTEPLMISELETPLTGWNCGRCRDGTHVPSVL